MWHDNETEVDLIGYGTLAITMNELVQLDNLLPLTLGVFGDWGSGKSSIMQMSKNLFKDNHDYVTVFFSPWQHEKYEDVKTSLMEAIMKALLKRRNIVTKLTGAGQEQIEKLWKKITTKINWFKLLTFTGKGLAGLVTAKDAPGITAGLFGSGFKDLSEVFQSDDFKEIIEDGDEKESNKDNDTSLEQSVNEFRNDFAKLLQKLEIKAVVVYIDDLDRCLPQNIIETFEAIRLFLAVPKSAFIIGADERIVRHAIATRYPEISGQAVAIGRDYLEKIIQFPIRIPIMTSSETETYLNLLGCQLYLEKSKFEKVIEVTNQNRIKGVLEIAMNYGILKSIPDIEPIPPALESHMQLIARIAPTLTKGLLGNPRQTKRFINTLIYRQRLAKTRNQVLDGAVLAKLMILEYFNEAFFRKLFEWQQTSGGTVNNFRNLEAEVNSRSGSYLSSEDKNPSFQFSQDEKEWLNSSDINLWLRLEPSLVSVNLQPYFYFSRDRVFSTTAPGRRLSQQQQEIINQLQDDADAIRGIGLKALQSLSVPDIQPIFEDLAKRFISDPRAVNNKLGEILLKITADKRELIPLFVQTLRDTPVTNIQPAIVIQMKNNFGANVPLPREVADILNEWSKQEVNKRLASAAREIINPTR